MPNNLKLSYKRELEILKQLEHPFIVKLIDHFIDEKDRVCFVTEYCNGGDLENFIN